MLAGYGREGAQVGHLELRIGHNLEEDAGGLVVDHLTHRLGVGQVSDARLDAKAG